MSYQEKNIKNIVDHLLGQKQSNNSFNFINQDDIINIILELNKIIFFEYFYNDYKHSLKNYLSIKIQEISYNLSKQIAKVLKYLPNFSTSTEEELFYKGQELSLKFLEKLPKIQALLKTDLQATFDSDPAAYNKVEIVCAYPGLFAIMVNRVAHELYLLNVPILPRIMTEYAHAKTGIDIHPGATLGKYFFIDHGTGIVIGETAILGNNVKIYQGVTIGALSTRGGHKLYGKKRHPTIEDNVIIYAGASILGGETVIGKNCVIGGNVFVTSSIPENTKVSLKNQELELNFVNSKAYKKQ